MRPFPIDVIPAHAYLTVEDQQKLFGLGYPMTVLNEHTQPGQLVYKETIRVVGVSGAEIEVHILGPNWLKSFVELSGVEAKMLGYDLEEVKTGDLQSAGSCRLVGPEGEIFLERGLIVPRPCLTLNLEMAENLGISNGQEIDMEFQLRDSEIVEKVIARIHPTFGNRVEVNADYARKIWLARQTYAKIIR
jgi:propanediol utilization protein